MLTKLVCQDFARENIYTSHFSLLSCIVLVFPCVSGFSLLLFVAVRIRDLYYTPQDRHMHRGLCDKESPWATKRLFYRKDHRKRLIGNHALIVSKTGKFNSKSIKHLSLKKSIAKY